MGRPAWCLQILALAMIALLMSLALGLAQVEDSMTQQYADSLHGTFWELEDQ